ncbi:MAG: HAMP domain-containing sensor histidine kinase [Thermoleophilaceae bacterium]
MTSVSLAAGAGWLAVLVLAVALLRMRHRLELVAEASHELRGPVTAISFAVASLRREPGGLRRALAFEAELERMRAGLADLEAARSGRRPESRPTPIGVDRLVRGAAAGWRPAAQSNERRLRFRWEGGPVSVRADSGRLAQAFGNLLANAVEHGSGPVELHGRREGGCVRVEVRDDGGGVAKPVPVGFSTAGERGRGLAIAARAVEEAGGTLSVERRPEGGTVASVELPIAEP